MRLRRETGDFEIKLLPPDAEHPQGYFKKIRPNLGVDDLVGCMVAFPNVSRSDISTGKFVYDSAVVIAASISNDLNIKLCSFEMDNGWAIFTLYYNPKTGEVSNEEFTSGSIS